MSSKDKLLLREFSTFDYQTPKDEKGDFKLSEYGNIVIRGIIQRANAKNQNGRVYPRNILQREIENYMQLVKERRATGELDHMDSPTVNLKNVSHVINKIWWEGDDVWGEIEVLEDTTQGKNLKALIKNGIKVGISSRSLGNLQEIGDTKYVLDDLYILCWDMVSEPSTHGAFMMSECKTYSEAALKGVYDRSVKLDRLANAVLSHKKG